MVISTRFLTFATAILCCIAASGQSASRKTYSGPFSILSGHGTATYTYLDAPDGTRIFDGLFTYRGDAYTLTGQFKDDKQYGRWTYTNTYKNPFFKTLTKIVASFSFDEDGLLSGPVSEKAYFKNGTVIEFLSYTLEEGKPDGPCKYTNWQNTKETISASFDKGVSVGTWKYTYPGTTPLTVEYDEKSGKAKVIETDPSTGDKKVYYDKILSSPLEFSFAKPWNLCLRKSVVSFTSLDPYFMRDAIIGHSKLSSQDFIPDAEVNIRCIVEKDGSISGTKIISGVNEIVDTDALQLIEYLDLRPQTRYNEEPIRTVFRLNMVYHA